MKRIFFLVVFANAAWFGLSASRAEEITARAKTAAYALDNPSILRGYFPAGAQLTVLDNYNDAMAKVRFRSPSGKVVEALCRKSDLGIASGDGPPATSSAGDPTGINKAFGIDLWQDGNLWDDVDADVGRRLGWPEESRTKTLSSYRRYTGPDVKVLGVRPYSLTFLAEDGKPTEFSMVFANKGDYQGFAGEDLENRKGVKRALKEFEAVLNEDAAALEKALTPILGEPERIRYGQGKNVRDTVLRWDWGDHAILLATPEGEFVGLRIVPGALADSGGKVERVRDIELRTMLAGRVEKRPKGDVVVGEIPMVDQGPKGFCVPATWSRYLRYMGVPSDMYGLAMAGQTGIGGGTYLHAMSDSVEDLLRKYGKKLQKINNSLKIQNINKYIDKGLPIMWTMFVNRDLDKDILERTADRKKCADWDAWKARLEEPRRKAEKEGISEGGAHICMIIGYNENTEELAISDSWGPLFAERWLTVEEAEAITQGDLMVIRW
ncbi:MAG: C39 family peptidase [Verrucomicrobia bacterium]|nr:C39 family peptidase [Verrucomicrobiota bacterium]